MSGERPQPSTDPNPTSDPVSPRTTSWQKLKFAIKAVEIRLRFVAILIGIGLLIGYWDTLRNYWDKWTRPVGGTVAVSTGEEFYCPMHPNVIRSDLEPDGSVPKCPICGMKLSLRQIGGPVELPEGVLTRVQLSPERIELAGIRTVPVVYQPLVKELRTVGYVEYDESRLSQAVARASGYIEKLYVDRSWQNVKQGDPLAELYSPALYSTSQELMVANERGLKELVASGRERLRLLGIGDQEIEQILASGKAATNIVIRAPLSGHVISKNIVAGARVEEGMTLFELADLSVVWIEAEVYEKDTTFLKVGQQVEASVEAFPNRVFEGTVALVHPHVERETRTNRVRLELPNPHHELRPGMYATVRINMPMSEVEPFASQSAQRAARPDRSDLAALAAWQKVCPVTGLNLGSMGDPVPVELNGQSILLCCPACVDQAKASPEQILAKLAATPAGEVLTVPQSAVIDTGMKKVVYVERELGQFDGIEVELGPRSGEWYPVISGLMAGDRVAAAGAFLIDAETRLNPAAASAFFGATGGAHEGHSHAAPIPQRQGTQLKEPGGQTIGFEFTAEQLSEIDKLSATDRKLALEQGVCPVTGAPLGSMGMPLKVTLGGQAVLLCCSSCEAQAKDNPAAVLEKLRSNAAAAR